MRRAPAGRTFFVAILLSGAALPAHAQDFDRVIPRPPESTEVPSLPPPPEAPPPSTDQTVLVPVLRGLVFVSSAGAVQQQGVVAEAVANDYSAEDMAPLQDPAVAARLRSYIGHPLTRAGLDSISRAVEDAYRAGSRPFVYVSVPPQSVQSGVVQIVVTEYRVGEISVTGNRHFATRQILGMSDLERGDPLTLPGLRKALGDYNQNPFLNVSAVTRPGANTGESDVVLEARDQAPIRVYAGYDNQGVPTLGRDEWYVGFNWGNVFGTGQILSYQYTRSFEDRYESHSFSDVIPLTPDLRLLLFGAYGIQRPFIAEVFDNEGHSGQMSGRLAVDLPDWGGVEQRLLAGIDYKRADNNLEFFGFRILDTAVEVFQFPLIYTATIPDRLGSTVVENTLVVSPGNVTKYNTDADLRQLVPGAKANYVYDRLSVTRTTNLGKGTAWVVRGMVQVSSANLPYSEQVGGGGIGSVRGYDTNTALGSEGVLLSTELRFPAVNVVKSLDRSATLTDQLQFGLFVDYAHLRQRAPFPDVRSSTELASFGVNANYSLTRYATIQVAIGTQLTTPPGHRGASTRADVAATFGF